MAGLPEVARRLLTHEIGEGTPLWRSVRLSMRGQIKLGRWRSFTARQVLVPSAGFVWAATATVAGLPVTGFDRYETSRGRMRWRLLGLVPVMTADGDDVTRSAAGRLAAESACWVPTAFGSARWSAGDARDSVCVARSGYDEVVTLRVAEDGRLTGAGLPRWGNPDGEAFGRYPFGMTAESERSFSGITIPSRIRAGWWWGTDRASEGEFFRAELDRAEFA